jgi:hypothetical protein
MRADLTRAVDLYVDLFRRTFETYADLTESALRRRGVAVSGAPDGAAAPVAPVVLVTGSGGVAEGPVWLHNATDEALAPHALEATALVAHGGAALAASRVRVTPAPLPAVAAGGSVEATVRVDAGGVPAGRYVGHLLTPWAALALHVEVGP